MARSSQGHIKVKSTQKGENSLFLLFLFKFSSIEISMIVETQLDTNNELYQTYPNKLQGWYRVWRGYTPANHPYVTPVWNSRNWPNNKTIVLFRSMVNTSILCDEVQTVYTRGPKGWGWAL